MIYEKILKSCEVNDTLIPALAALLKAFHYASDVDCSVWDFAISIRRLLSLGASETDLRWLVKKGFVEHGREVTIEGDDGRAFRSTGNLTFSCQTCFVLTEAGIKVAQLLGDPLSSGRVALDSSNGQRGHNPSPPVPQWDAESRKLELEAQLVKRFKWPAANQEAVLCAFQEEGWPDRIDDPLPPQPEQNSKRRLADTIKCLNRKQANELIHFRGDGTGEGVVWERRKCGIETGNS